MRKRDELHPGDLVEVPPRSRVKTHDVQPTAGLYSKAGNLMDHRCNVGDRALVLATINRDYVGNWYDTNTQLLLLMIGTEIGWDEWRHWTRVKK